MTDVVAWILAGLLSAGFFFVGLAKLVTPYKQLLDNPRMAWAGDFTPTQIKLISGVEVLGAIGVTVPWLVDVAPVLSPIAAVGLAVVMVGAAITHSRRREWDALASNGVLFALAAAVAVLRFTQLS